MGHARLDKKSGKNKIISFIEDSFNDSRGSNLRYTLVYSVAFLMLTFAVYIPFILREKSFVWETDGMSQHYLALIYIGKWLRELLGNIFIEHNFVIPMWDMSIGAGGDVLTTFNYYGLGDPLCALSVFVPEKYTLYLYSFIVIARMYLTGLFFSFYAFRMKQRGIGVLLGSFSYVFCGFSIYAGVRHPFFLIPMMLFPLMLLGAEKVLNRESPVLFILTVTMSFSTNFYFSYMLVILTVIYVAVRFFTTKSQNKLKLFFRTLGKFLLFGAIGVMIAAVLLLPVMIVFFSNGRSDVERESKLLYDLSYYLSLYSGFMSYNTQGSWTVTGFIPATLISAILLFKRKGEHKYLKILLVICGVMLLLPIFGRAMNGFAYVANRWIWAYGFFLSYTLALMFKRFTNLNQEEKRCLFKVVSVYLLSCILFININVNDSGIAQYIILGFITALLVCGEHLFKKKSNKIITVCVSVLCIVSIIANTGYCYSYMHKNYPEEFIDMDNAYAMITESVSSKMAENTKEEFGRYEQIPNSAVRNQSVVDGSYGIAYYWSLNDNHVGEFLTDTHAVTYTDYDFVHFGRRTFHDELFSVKYYYSSSKGVPSPYGYEFVKSVNTSNGSTTTEFDVYENKYALPLGFGYSEYMTKDEYDSLSAAEKAEALMSNILLDEDIEGYNKNTYSTTSRVIDHRIVSMDGVSMTGNTFTATKDDAKVVLEFDPVKNQELYLDMQGIYCLDHLTEYEIKQIEEEKSTQAEGPWNKLYIPEKYKIFRSHLLSRDEEKYVINVSCNGLSSNFNISTPYYQNYDGQHNYLFNMYYSDSSRNTVTITFKDAGVYSIENIDIIAQPMNNYVEKATARGENTLENVQINDNGFYGTVDLAESQLMFFSVPYSRGFEAYVDGEKAEILRANTWGMALDLDAGEHTVEFRYRTTGLTAGMIISAVGIAALAGVAIYYKKRKAPAKL
ncbi:MAG: YfhO family protein [Clostridia bacterium]|nr:YfhO family protein [Clostridia bacterium]